MPQQVRVFIASSVDGFIAGPDDELDWLGEGIPLFAGASRRHRLELEEARPLGAGLVQLHYRPRPS